MQRKYNRDKTKVGILQIEDQRSDLRNQLELRVRSSVQTAAASYFSVQQYKSALKAAEDNFEVVQDSYGQGVVSVTNLIDAQNAMVQIQLGSVNANYQLILDGLGLERAVGYYYQLVPDQEKAIIVQRLIDSLSN